MRPFCLAVSLLLLCIFLSSVQGIRLEKSFKSARHPKLHEGTVMKTSNEVMGEVILCKEGHCSGTKKKKASRVLNKSHHWLPSIHEDYYGPRRHRAKHH
ncbi:hypothetical protein QQP08_027781 [Theobroma cacao]|nr:hypothetical protein QQP08_027781 [Theobroma cacao]